MVFSSIAFIFLFLPIFALFYYIPPFRAKNYILLLFSLLFYAWGEPIYIFLMIFVTLINYICGLFIHKYDKFKIKRLFFLILAIVFSVGCLGYFKYTNFLIDIVNSVFKIGIANVDIRLPIGISFFTFQTLSYTIDLYKREVDVEKNYAFFLMYVSMFPQLIAGPIVRFSTVQKEIRQRDISFDGFCHGLFRFCIGLFKKTLIANQMGLLWDTYNAMPVFQISFLGGLLGLVSFTLQLYFDFSAYSDMAIGLGEMMGFHFLENFNYPLSSLSITDFWRRWHISMSTWFRDYIYIPLGGNKVSKLKHFRNILVVWFVTGLWHGASWNFVAWGLFHAIFLLMEKNIYGKYLKKIPNIFQHIYTFLVVVFGFGIFAITDFTRLFDYLKAMKEGVLIDSNFLYYLNNFKIILIIALIFCFPIFPYFRQKIENCKNKYLKIIALTCIAVVFMILFTISVATLVSDTYNPFLYFRF